MDLALRRSVADTDISKTSKSVWSENPDHDQMLEMRAIKFVRTTKPKGKETKGGCKRNKSWMTLRKVGKKNCEILGEDSPVIKKWQKYKLQRKQVNRGTQKRSEGALRRRTKGEKYGNAVPRKQRPSNRYGYEDCRPDALEMGLKTKLKRR